MPDLWIVLITLGAAGRLTRLINFDIITGWIRAAIIRRWGAESLAADFIACPWCMGFWVSLAMAGLMFSPLAETQAYAIACFALTFSWVIGLIARNLDPHH